MENVKDQWLLIRKAAMQIRYQGIEHRVVKGESDWESGYARCPTVRCKHLDGSYGRYKPSDILRHATKAELIEAQRAAQ